jgi:uncharacterized protein (UPF0276 family)
VSRFRRRPGRTETGAQAGNSGTLPDIGWFEVTPKMHGRGRPPHASAEAVRQRYPLSVHGVGLSIGGAGALDKRHLQRLKALVQRYEPGLFSEHLAWSSHGGAYLNDLLPLPYTQATLAHVAAHVDEVQETLGRRVLIENPSTYVTFAASDMDETAFLAELARRTGCGLLLDVNNVYVSTVNHGFDAAGYIDAFPVDAVGEIHLAGHFETTDSAGAPLLIDAHGSPVRAAVWSLYARAIGRTGPMPTLIEWDNDIPSWMCCTPRRQADADGRGQPRSPADLATLQGDARRAATVAVVPGSLCTVSPYATTSSPASPTCCGRAIPPSNASPARSSLPPPRACSSANTRRHRPCCWSTAKASLPSSPRSNNRGAYLPGRRASMAPHAAFRRGLPGAHRQRSGGGAERRSDLRAALPRPDQLSHPPSASGRPNVRDEQVRHRPRLRARRR